MEGKCPKCQVRLEFPASGVYQCERCQCRFEVALGAPNPPAPPSPPPGSNWQGWGMQGGMPPAPAPMGAAPASGDPAWGAGSPMPTAEAATWGAPPMPHAGATCAGHPDNPASTVCERCGDFMCRLCTTQVEGRAYCPKCFDLLYSRGALGFAQRQFTAPGITLALGLAGLAVALCAPISIILGGIGILTGTRALKEYHDRPELPGRIMTLWGISLSVLAIVLGIIVLAALGFAIFRN